MGGDCGRWGLAELVGLQSCRCIARARHHMQLQPLKHAGTAQPHISAVTAAAPMPYLRLAGGDRLNDVLSHI